MVRPPHRRRATAGFSLTELLTVIAVIAISAAIAAPALSRRLAQGRAQTTVHETVRIGAVARSQAMAYGRAHLLLFTEASGGDNGDLGRLELWRGWVNRCRANDWVTVLGGGDCESSDSCIDAVDMDSYATTTWTVRMRVEGASDLGLCFEPDGGMLVSQGGIFSDTPPSGNDAVTFTFQRLRAGNAEGVVRRVVFPMGGTPRILR